MIKNYGTYKATIDLIDTPINRAGEIGVVIHFSSTYYPATYYEPESYDEEVEDIEIDKGLSEEEEAIIREWIDDNWDKIYDGNVDWYEPDYD